MTEETSPPLSSRTTPHIRLNSGRHEPFVDLEEGSQELRHQPSSRSLIPQGRVSPGLPSPYVPSAAESSELLIPPPRSFRSSDQEHSRSPSVVSSRRTSWESHSDAGTRDSRGYPYDPFADSRAPSRADSDDENVNTQTVSEKYNIMPTDGLLLFPEDVEKDDYLHNPDPHDKDRDCDICNTRGLLNVGGLALLTLGIVALFIVYPVTSFVEKLVNPHYPICHGNPLCLPYDNIPLLKNIRTGLIDPTTPDSVKKKIAADGSEWTLVFSDEFNTPGRTFYDGDDAYFQGVDLWYGVTQDLEWYDPDALTTNDGVLEIRFDAFQNHNLKYRSGMLQGWNKLCFTGGRLEASISLPGRGDVSGFWPGFWAMGNLGRAGYAATTDGMWPYSYHDECDAGITPNQSSTDGISFLPGMRLPACTCSGEDHPSPGRSRSAPEIDVIEASVGTLNSQLGYSVGTVSQSLQLAPYDLWYMPNYEFTALYDPRITSINGYRGGPYQQVASGQSNLNNDWYNGNQYQVYAFEYTPGAKGDVSWFIGQNPTWKIDARAIGPNGNIGQRVIPTEPMYPILNLGISPTFAFINWTYITPLLPATMRVDYIRIYQNPHDMSVTCDPEGYETTSYIANHPKPYTNPNLTEWHQAYDWPINSFMHGC